MCVWSRASASIASNNITPKGIQYLAKMLEKVQKLEVLLYGFASLTSAA